MAAVSDQVPETVALSAKEFRDTWNAIEQEIGKAIVGQRDVVEGVLTCLFVGGHALLEGVPGLGKTLLIRSLAQALNLPFNRVQFTPDLMPADVIGTNIIVENETGGRQFQFQRGPIFTQILLADEINRATPKTQSALLEAMQEKQVTSGGTQYLLAKPFFVMATQNPIEQEGTYPLPEAQLDRFLFKLVVPFVTREELATVLDRTTTGHVAELTTVCDGPKILAMQKVVQNVLMAPHVQDYAIRLVLATHPVGPGASEPAKKYIRAGASPRAAQAITLASKVRALLDNRYNTSFADVRKVFYPAVRHRILLNFEAQAEAISPDAVLKFILDETPEVERR